MADVTGTSLTSLDGLFKRVYAKELKNLIPSWAILQTDLKFMENKKTGEDYMQPVVLKMEQGVTYSASGAGAFALNAPVTGLTAKAVVTGYQHVIRSAIDYETAFSGSSGERAFKSATAAVVESMWSSIRKRLEIDLLYGQVAAGLGVAGTIDNSSKSITFTDATWAPGIWAGMEGASVYVTATGGTTTRTLSSPTIASVDLDNKKITLSAKVSAGVATDVVFLSGMQTGTTPTYNGQAGIDKIITNTGSLFGISASTYNLWKGVSHSAGSTDLSFGTILDAVSKIVSKGADSDLNVYVSPKTWANLMNDTAALRRYDYSYKTSTATMGAQKLEFWGQLGKITVKPHPMVKQGEAFGLSPGLFKRIGATDITFSRPPMAGAGQQGEFFRELYDRAGFELRAYDHQALFTHAPGKAFKITNIVNS